MGELFTLFGYAVIGLAIATIIYTGRGGHRIIMAIVHWIQHELLMRPKTRYYIY